jgi:hypothetical protein
VPPEAEAVNVVDWPVVGEDGLNVKRAERSGGLVTVTDCWEPAVC